MRRETIFEFHRVGGFVKVTAVDVSSGEEITITGDAKATQDYLQRLARDRLIQVLTKKGLIK